MDPVPVPPRAARGRAARPPHPPAPVQRGADMADDAVPPGRAWLTEAPLDPDDADADGPLGSAGARVVFTGVVRADPLVDGGGARVVALDLECYPAMARSELEAIRREAAARFGLAACAIGHRVGRAVVGEDLVLVVAAAPHRRDAFAAAAWIMDAVKRRVPVWKREIGPTGPGAWVHPQDCGCLEAGPAATGTRPGRG